MPVICSPPEFKPDAQTMVAELTQMMWDNLQAQRKGIGERAWRVLQKQWFADAGKPDLPGGDNLSNNSTNNSSTEIQKERYDSKLEGDYYRLQEMKNDDNRRIELNKLAILAVNKANIERDYGYSYSDERYEDEPQRGSSLGM